MRFFWILTISASIAGCASAKPQLRGASEGERAQIDQALAPLIAASAICQGQDRCPIGVGVIQLRRIDMAVGPHPPNRFGLTITSGALKGLQPSELQSALAHELGHVQLGHFDSRAERRQSEPPPAKTSEGGEDALRRNRAYDREEEFAADRYAVDLLDRLPGGPGRGCADMLLLLERLDLEMTAPGWSNWLSTHPTPAARLQAIQRECGKKP